MFPGYYNPLAYLYQTNTTSPSSLTQTTTPSTPCCTSSTMLLEIMLYIHAGFHVLAVFAVPVLQNKEADHQQAAEMMVVGTSGALTTSLAIMGLWYRQRQFLLPLVFFLFATIVLDSASVFNYYYVSTPTVDETSLTKVNAISFYPITDPMSPYLIVKLLISIWLMQRLISTYRKNLTIRTGRSPLRKHQQPFSEDVEKRSDDKGSPILKWKVGKYSKFDNCVEEV